MKRFHPWLFHEFAALSLLLCTATIVLWVRSYSVDDSLFWTGPKLSAGFEDFNGRSLLWLERTPVDDAYGSPYGICYATRFPPADLDQAWHPSLTTYLDRGGFRFRAGIYGYRYDRNAVIPFLFLYAATALMPFSAFIRFVRRFKQPQAGLCPTCGYDLRATPDRCPECGTIPEPKGIASS